MCIVYRFALVLVVLTERPTRVHSILHVIIHILMPYFIVPCNVQIEEVVLEHVPSTMRKEYQDILMDKVRHRKAHTRMHVCMHSHIM